MKKDALLTFVIDRELDLVGLRQRTRRLSEILNFDTQDQTRIATAVSEVAREAASSGQSVSVTFHWEDSRGVALLMELRVRVAPGAAEDESLSDGINRARRLMDDFSSSGDSETRIFVLEKRLPRSRSRPDLSALSAAAGEIGKVPADPLLEARAQNKELLDGLSEIREKQDELERLNQELETTNRGVVALYAELDEKSQALQHLNRTLEERVDTAIRERERAQDALRQSQKMEAVGQLTGGIAHDFNNLLQTITGNLEIIERHLPSDQPRLRRSLGFATRGAKSAASLTRRLLAFSRRQSLDPRPTDASQLVLGMTELLRRTLGEHVQVSTNVADAACLIEIDANELENALLNLAVNARDAMPDGGTLRIETRHVDLSMPLEDFASAPLPSGPYVFITIADSGHGMAEDVRLRVFEPFFTTKAVGKGTGLGLSMVFGFAKQSGATSHWSPRRAVARPCRWSFLAGLERSSTTHP